MPCDYGDDPYPITMGLIEEGRDHLLLRAPMALSCPIHLLQGMRDEDVPWRTALRKSPSWWRASASRYRAGEGRRPPPLAR